MSKSIELLPLSQELSISEKAHGVLHLAMMDAAQIALNAPSVEKEWKIIGLPTGTAALAGNPSQKYPTPYNFMDMTVVQEHESADLSCELFFHGHPRQHTKTATLMPQDTFDLVFDNGNDRNGEAQNLETFTNPSKSEMFTYLFKLIGHEEIPPTVQHPDTIDFDSNVALEALLDSLFAHEYADSSTLTERRKYASMLGSSIGGQVLLNTVDVHFVRSTTYRRSDREQTLDLVASETFDVFRTSLTKKLTYNFPVGLGPDSNETSARLEVTASDAYPAAPEDQLKPLLQRTILDTSENFLPHMRQALATIDARAAASRLSD